ncbi:MAG TPA: arsenite methyltransferase [Anaerolineales bacterium]|nr:arsenite methyltransferase [Anaerolineales bacterium]
MNEGMKDFEIRSAVRERYARHAEQEPSRSGCGCEPSSCCGDGATESPVQWYEDAAVAGLPVEVTGLSLGCGDPVTLAELQPGQTVLDLGSGGGIDSFLAARQVGPTGHVIGVDMTPAMLDRARANQEKMGVENVDFRLGEIEHLPVADSSVDVIISNCVINLSPDKPQVFQEAYRVLKPGGKLAVSDIVTDGPLPEHIKYNLSAWAGCMSGALEVQDYIASLEAAGFVKVNITPTYLPQEVVDQAVEELGDAIPLEERTDPSIYQAVFSARISAQKSA